MSFISMSRRRSGGVIRLALEAALAAVLAVSVARAAQDGQAAASAQKTPPADPWVVNCSTAAAGELQCQASQNLTENKTGRRVLTVTVRREGDGKDGYAMLLALPHGLFLPAGVSYRVDSGPVSTAQIQTSDMNGAYAVVAMPEKLLQAMKAGTQMNVGMESVTRRKVAIPVSLSGFTAALAKLREVR